MSLVLNLVHNTCGLIPPFHCFLSRFYKIPFHLYLDLRNDPFRSYFTIIILYPFMSHGVCAPALCFTHSTVVPGYQREDPGSISRSSNSREIRGVQSGTALDFFSYNFGLPCQLSYLYTSSIIKGWYSGPIWGHSSKGLSPTLLTKHYSAEIQFVRVHVTYYFVTLCLRR